MKEYDFTDLIELMENSILKMKQISKPKRWRAEKGDDYWYMCSEVYPLIEDEQNDPIDEKRFNAGNYFQTEAECQAFCDKVKELANGNN